MWTSLPLLLPINCNDDQNYIYQLSTTFMPHTFYVWSYYYPQDQYELFYSFYFSQDHRNKAKSLDSTLIFIIYSSQTRLHRSIIKQNSKLDHTKLYSTRSRYNQKDRTKKKGKDRSVTRYRGTSPKLGSCQGECPYPCVYVSFLGGGDDGVVDDVGWSSIFQGIGSPS